MPLSGGRGFPTSLPSTAASGSFPALALESFRFVALPLEVRVLPALPSLTRLGLLSGVGCQGGRLVPEPPRRGGSRLAFSSGAFGLVSVRLPDWACREALTPGHLHVLPPSRAGSWGDKGRASETPSVPAMPSAPCSL